ncbi:MAG: hypothetical protein RLY30_860 [Pseudomonadota bacterium]|jgi:hypothetical protein
MISKTYDGQAFTEYLDFESIEETGPDTVRVEEIQDLHSETSTKSGKFFASLRITAEYDLKRHTRRTLEKMACSEAMGGGDVVLVDRTQGAWTPVEPGSNHAEKVVGIQKAKKLGFW